MYLQEQNIIEKTNKDAQNKLTDSNIQDAIKYIKTLSTTGQLNDNTLYSYTRYCRSKTKIFLEIHPSYIGMLTLIVCYINYGKLEQVTV